MTRKFFHFLFSLVFLQTCLFPYSVHAGGVSLAGVPLATLTPAYTPALLKGMVINLQDPLKFDFIIQKGDRELDASSRQVEYQRLIKYFLTSLTVPDTDQWVNLSPYEQTRMIADNFGATRMGHDFLAQDYLLKQITSSLSDPQSELGSRFWKKIYEQAYQKFGRTDVPTDVFNKVWITPESVKLYEKDNTVYVLDSRLKVQLEADYLASRNAQEAVDDDEMTTLSKQVMREVILPALDKEVNEGENFAVLRQVYSGMLLAAWYKRTLKESVLTGVYGNKSKLAGLSQDPENNEKIYRQYLEAFTKGAYNMVREEVDSFSREPVARRYFSGGLTNAGRALELAEKTNDPGQVPRTDLDRAEAAAVTLLPDVDQERAAVSQNVAQSEVVSSRADAAQILYLGDVNTIAKLGQLKAASEKRDGNSTRWEFDLEGKRFTVTVDVPNALFVSASTLEITDEKGRKYLYAAQFWNDIRVPVLSWPEFYERIVTRLVSMGQEVHSQRVNSLLNASIVRVEKKRTWRERLLLGRQTEYKPNEFMVNVDGRSRYRLYTAVNFTKRIVSLSVVNLDKPEGADDAVSFYEIPYMSGDDSVATVEKLRELLRDYLQMIHPPNLQVEPVLLDRSRLVTPVDAGQDVSELLKGGIDFAERSLDMQILRDGNGVPLPASQQDFSQVQINGFEPQIELIRPVSELGVFKAI